MLAIKLVIAATLAWVLGRGRIVGRKNERLAPARGSVEIAGIAYVETA